MLFGRSLKNPCIRASLANIAVCDVQHIESHRTASRLQICRGPEVFQGWACCCAWASCESPGWSLFKVKCNKKCDNNLFIGWTLRLSLRARQDFCCMMLQTSPNAFERLVSCMGAACLVRQCHLNAAPILLMGYAGCFGIVLPCEYTCHCGTFHRVLHQADWGTSPSPVLHEAKPLLWWQSSICWKSSGARTDAGGSATAVAYKSILH